MNRMSPVVKNLVILNVAVFVIQYLTFPIVDNLGALHYPLSSGFKAYQLFTYMFLHSVQDPLHIVFNMLWLYFMGTKVEYYLGNTKFTTLYLVAGIGSAIFHLAVNEYLFGGPMAPMVGASGAVAGILMAAALVFPNDEIILFPIPIPIKVKYLVLFYTIKEVYQGLNPSPYDNVAHFAHVGGLLFGFIYLKLFSGGNRYQY